MIFGVGGYYLSPLFSQLLKSCWPNGAVGLESVGGVWLPLEQMLSLPQLGPVVVITNSLFIFKTTLLAGLSHPLYLNGHTSRTS